MLALEDYYHVKWDCDYYAMIGATQYEKVFRSESAIEQHCVKLFIESD